MSKIGTIIAFLILHFSSLGQILNVEKKREGLDKKGWQGNIDFTAKYTKNTSDIFQLANRSTVSYKKELKTFLILTDLKLIKKNRENLINQGVVHLRYIKQLERAEKLKFELFAQSQFNAVQKINLRSILGADFRFKVLGNDTINLNFGSGAMYEYEESLLKTYESILRFTNYISFNWNIKDKWKLRLISYYQPKFGELSDYRISTETALSYKVSKQFSIVGVVTSLFDTQPIEGIPKDYFTGNLMFRYKF